MQFRNLYFEFYSQFKIPQITSIFSSPRPVTKPLVTATSIPKIYPQFSIYDLDMYKVNNIPIVVEGQIIEICQVRLVLILFDTLDIFLVTLFLRPVLMIQIPALLPIVHAIWRSVELN